MLVWGFNFEYRFYADRNYQVWFGKFDAKVTEGSTNAGNLRGLRRRTLLFSVN